MFEVLGVSTSKVPEFSLSQCENAYKSEDIFVPGCRECKPRPSF